MVILTSNTNSNKYLFYVLNSNRILHEIKKISTGSTFKRINLAEIKKLKILLPPLDEQEKIMNILWNIDVKKITDVTNKMKIEKMKSGLMQILLSGRVRVRLDEGGLHRIRNS
jgi:type I restriction enzyme S subunit